VIQIINMILSTTYLSNYDELFHEHTGLPPKREVEHKIYLQQDAPLPNMGMY